MKKSFGILLYRIENGQPEFLLVHPGGPFFKNKDTGVWSVPKGEADLDTEEPLQTAIREFEEETGFRPDGDFKALQPVLQKGGKQVYCWLVRGDFDVHALKSNTFSMEWPPRSGRMMAVPEVDRVEWFSLESAKMKINERQAALLEEAAAVIGNVL